MRAGIFGPLAAGYPAMMAAAIDAARRNNAALWFAGEPSDLAGFVYQDSGATTPATGTDPIGLMLDRSYGAENKGSEHVTTATASLGVGVGFTAITGEAAVVGKVYEITYSINQTSGDSQSEFGGIPFSVDGGAVVANRRIIGTATNTNAPRCFSNMAVGTISNFSVREVLGFPATQATAANKPTLELQANGYYGQKFGPTLDDSLSTAITAGSTVSFGMAIKARALQNSTAMGADGNTYAAKSCAFKLRANGDIWLLGDSVGNTPVASAAYAANTPVVVRGKIVGGVRSIYINGVLSDSRAGTFTPGAEVVQLGQATNLEFFDGTSGPAWWANGNVSDADALALDRFCSLVLGGPL